MWVIKIEVYFYLAMNLYTREQAKKFLGVDDTSFRSLLGEKGWLHLQEFTLEQVLQLLVIHGQRLEAREQHHAKKGDLIEANRILAERRRAFYYQYRLQVKENKIDLQNEIAVVSLALIDGHERSWLESVWEVGSPYIQAQVKNHGSSKAEEWVGFVMESSEDKVLMSRPDLRQEIYRQRISREQRQRYSIGF